MVVDFSSEGGGEGFGDLLDRASSGGETMSAEVDETVGSWRTVVIRARKRVGS